MIRSTLKSGIKRLLGVEVKPTAAPAPPPAWRSEPAVKVEPPAPRAAASVAAPVAPSVAAPVAPPVDVAPAAAPVAAAPVEAEPAPQAPVAVEVAEAVEPAPKKTKAKKAKKGEEPEVAAAPTPIEVDAPPPAAAAPTDTVGPAAFSMEQVQELFDEMVRPALQGDGGDISLLRIEQNDVYVRLVGSCSSCPSSVMTMKMGVEALLREELPGFGNLIQVD